MADIATSIEKPGHDHGTGAHPRYLIKPGCPKQSFFLSIIREGKMPPAPAEKISPETIKAIEQFIIALDPKAGKMCDDEPPDSDGPGSD